MADFPSSLAAPAWAGLASALFASLDLDALPGGLCTLTDFNHRGTGQKTRVKSYNAQHISSNLAPFYLFV
jgi:hypothetical protein